MRLRRTSKRHQAGVDSTLWWEFKPGDRVLTVEGILGRVTAVEDGPHPGNEAYIVELDMGLGGGEYLASELTAAKNVTAMVPQSNRIAVEKEWDRLVQQHGEQGWGMPLRDWAFYPAQSGGASARAAGHANFELIYVAVADWATEQYPLDSLIDTVRHEVAHVLAGPGAGHGRDWQNWARTVGADPSAKVSEPGMVDPGYKWFGVCPVHGWVAGWFRKPSRGFAHNKCGERLEITDDWDEVYLWGGYTGSKEAVLQIREHNYRGEDGFLISGTDGRGRGGQKVFVPKSMGRDAAEAIREKMKQGEDWSFNDFKTANEYVVENEDSGDLVSGPFDDREQAQDEEAYQESGTDENYITMRQGTLHLAQRDPENPNAGLDLAEEVARSKDFSHSGLVVKALDSGRVLLTQRTPYEGDPEGVYGRWEFPGGSVDDSGDLIASAIREFEEETGLSLPEGYYIEGAYASDNYLAVIVLVPHEAWVAEAHLLTHETEGVGWFKVDDIEGTELVREEMESADWDMIREALKKGAGFYDLDLCPLCGKGWNANTALQCEVAEPVQGWMRPHKRYKWGDWKHEYSNAVELHQDGYSLYVSEDDDEYHEGRFHWDVFKGNSDLDIAAGESSSLQDGMKAAENAAEKDMIQSKHFVTSSKTASKTAGYVIEDAEGYLVDGPYVSRQDAVEAERLLREQGELNLVIRRESKTAVDEEPHTADLDYPELSDILLERPPLLHSERVSKKASKTAVRADEVKVGDEMFPGVFVTEVHVGKSSSYEYLFSLSDGSKVGEPYADVNVELVSQASKTADGFMTRMLEPLADYMVTNQTFIPESIEVVPAGDEWAVLGRDEYGFRRVLDSSKDKSKAMERAEELRSNSTPEPEDDSIPFRETSLDPEFNFHFTSAWRDIQEKASRIRSGGYVRVISASPAYIAGEIQGDTNIYQAVLHREGTSNKVALWECGCAWASYSWGRSGRWKKYEGRMCSHALALLYESQSRGWGGQEIGEDAEKPNWMSDPSIVVQRPGDYKKTDGGNWRLDASKKDAGFLDFMFREPGLVDPSVRPSFDIPDNLGAGESEAMRNQLKELSKEFISQGISPEQAVEMARKEWRSKFPNHEREGARRARPISTDASLRAAPSSVIKTSEEERFIGECGSCFNPEVMISGYTGNCDECDRDDREFMEQQLGTEATLSNHVNLTLRSELKDEPEAALPETTADDEIDASDFTGEETDLAGEQHSAPAAVLEDDPELVGEDTDLPPVESRMWLMEGTSGGSGGGDVSNDDIALAAKQALKEFSPDEQRELISEGELEGSVARNLDKLEVSGTHYEALERAFDEEEEQENDDMWLL